MNHIPKFLILTRLFIGILIITLSTLHIPNYSIYAITLFSIGLLTDIFDGIIARRLNISTQTLRRMDSTTDLIFFILVAAATFIQCPQFFKHNKIELILLLSAEASTYLICFIKFQKEIATHSIAAKIWTLILFATLIQIMTTCQSKNLFQICFYTGLITRIEIIAIILILPKWTNDIPTIYHALQIRKGNPIKRNKHFNG